MKVGTGGVKIKLEIEEVSMRGIVAEAGVMMVGMVLLGIFTMTFKSGEERRQILNRLTSVGTSFSELVDKASR